MNLLPLEHVCSNGSVEVGGKAQGLAELIQAAFPVPSGWVIPAEVCRAHFTEWGVVGDEPRPAAMANVSTCELAPSLLRALEALPDVAFAVRSSAASEDCAAASYSGVFDTVLGVRGLPSLVEAVRKVWASALTPEALSYHRQVSKTSGYPSMAVILMPMVDAIAAGVAFSAHPVDGNPFVISVSASYGLGTTVVNGRLPVDRYLLDRDTLAVKGVEIGRKTVGEYLASTGHIEVREIDETMQEQAALDDKTLEELGRLARRIDQMFDARVDVEFAVTEQGVVVLQARRIVGLPPHFPDDPRSGNSEAFCCHSERMDPLSPYALANIEALMHSVFPRPPWPMEVGQFLCRHGRVFAEYAEDPAVTECPETPWNDRGFIGRMLAFDAPELAFSEWYEYADLIYGSAIPTLRESAERILRLDINTLRDMAQDEFVELAQEAIHLDIQAGALYQSTSYPTYETLRRIDILIRDSLELQWQEAQELALTMIQGAPKLTHLRDAEVEEAASCGQVDDVVLHWGYSYLRRDDLLDISTWKSWREDPAPLLLAVSNMRKMPPTLSIAERVRHAATESDARLLEVTDAIVASPRGGQRYADVFAACVHASRRLFPLKDDRDIVLSHAQSAARWVLLEAGRRFVEMGGITIAQHVFLLRPDEILAATTGELGPHEVARLVDERSKEQIRLARYTVPQTSQSSQETGECCEVFDGEPANAGVAEGSVRIIMTDRPEEIGQLQPGEILWLRGEGKVGWTMYFPIIAGLICSGGNWLCHETNLCRELGIPAVTGIHDMPAIRSGDRIRIDGGTGRVALVERHQGK